MSITWNFTEPKAEKSSDWKQCLLKSISRGSPYLRKYRLNTFFLTWGNWVTLSKQPWLWRLSRTWVHPCQTLRHALCTPSEREGCGARAVAGILAYLGRGRKQWLWDQSISEYFALLCLGFTFKTVTDIWCHWNKTIPFHTNTVLKWNYPNLTNMGTVKRHNYFCFPYQ